jgi:formylglycine-generating enzyme required for sulfatase activity
MIVSPTSGQILPAGTTSTTLTVTISNHTGHWHWQLNTPFPTNGAAGGNVVTSGNTTTITGLQEGQTYTVYVTLVDANHTVLSPPVTASVTFSVAAPAPQPVPPTVSNVQAAQRRDGSRLVDITYNLSDPDSDSLLVTVELSPDDGKTWTPLRTVSGAVGRGVTPGVRKQVVWNVGVDYPGQVGRNSRVRVTADDANLSPGGGSNKTITMTLPGGATIEMVWIPPGTFLMGTTEEQEQLLRNKGLWYDWFENEHPAHEVTITTGFYLGMYEVTQGQWTSVMGTKPWAGQSYVMENPEHPAVYVSWEDAQEFLRRVNAAEGAGVYRLPTEAEWEYACRAGTTTLWSFGEDEGRLKDHAWYRVNAWNVGEQYAHKVGTKLPNPWGLYDMHGNVWEWCQDWWYRIYTADAQVDPVGPGSGSDRVVRGGGFDFIAQHVRSAIRINYWPARYDDVGFRLLRQGQ